VSDSKGDSEHEFQKLSRAITEAVLRSEKIRRIVGDINKKDKLCSHSFMVLVLNMQSLLEGVEPSPPEAPEEIAEKKPSKRPRKRREHGHIIDGKKLSKNEIAFEEFIQGKFDADEWLRRNRLKL
jgi:hypothetical protein